MNLIIDCREAKLINELESKQIDFSKKALDIGDMQIVDLCGNIIVLFERKTIADLLSSIKDGRYGEQSVRLDSSNTHNHYIYYLIEGPINKYQNQNLIYSTMCSLSVYKGFSLLRTYSVKETAELLVGFYNKIKKEKRTMHYSIESNVPKEDDGYCANIKTKKNENITPDNIMQIMLIQIPYVSVKTAQTLSSKYKVLNNLLDAIENNKPELYSLKTENEVTKKTRKISKKAIDNLCTFLK
tara:strand:- start:3953 stop:4675 length:723 start_codon:yes stop_codon:yes gene_type:complete